MVADFDLLDQLSTRQTSWRNVLTNSDISHRTLRETEAHIEEAELEQSRYCVNGAPHIFYVDQQNKAHVVQGCCNDWTCPRCGLVRAKAEYGRMVNGANELSEKGLQLYFVTLTCRGKELTVADAESCYYGWCNRLTTAMRTKCKRAGTQWYSAAVTERQQRQHPHTHMIASWCPPDATPYKKGDWLPNGATAKHDGLYSQWLVDTATAAGLGKMCDVSAINSPVAVAVYLSKYMFKDAMRTIWPKGWRRVRYSNSWPKLPYDPPPLAFPLVRYADWLRMEQLGMTVYAENEQVYEAALARLMTCVTFKQKSGV